MKSVPENTSVIVLIHGLRLMTRLDPTRDEVTGGWGKLHGDELHASFFSPRAIRMVEWGDCKSKACSYDEKFVHNFLHYVYKPEGREY
jgi:hypothetical protein